MRLREDIEIEFYNDGIKNYFVASVTQEVGIVEYEVNMIENNASLGILNLVVNQFDDKIKLMYDITNKVPLNEILEAKNLSKEEFITLMRNILRSLSYYDELMLENGLTLLEPKFIFVDERNLSAQVLYIPVMDKERTIVKREFRSFVNLIYNNYVNVGGSKYAEIIDKIITDVKSDRFDIPKLYKEIEYLYNNISKVDVVNKISETPVETYQEPVQYESRRSEPIVRNTVRETGDKKFNFRLFFICIFQVITIIVALITFFVIDMQELYKIFLIVGMVALDVIVCLIVVLVGMFNGNEGEGTEKVERRPSIKPKTNTMRTKKQEEASGNFDTVILGQNESLHKEERTKRGYIISNENGEEEKHLINKDIFVIGRLVGEVDLIAQNRAIGKMHCEIHKEGPTYFVIDNNSKNGTFVNGTRINAGNKYEIKDQDELKLANSIYKFVIE